MTDRPWTPGKWEATGLNVRASCQGPRAKPIVTVDPYVGMLFDADLIALAPELAEAVLASTAEKLAEVALKLRAIGGDDA